ncbi:unnamed protein product [Musa textilis]
MLAPPDSLGLVLPQVCCGARLGCPCKVGDAGRGRRKRLYLGILSDEIRARRWRCGASMPPVGNNRPSLNAGFLSSAKGSVQAQKILVSGQLADKLVDEESASRTVQLASRFTSYQEDPLVDKLRTQLGVIHPIPSPPINRNIVGFFVFFFFIGVAFDKVWTSGKKNKSHRDVKNGTWPQVPTSFSTFFEKDLQRKESVEWVNMVLGKLWKVYRPGIENWIIGLLQPVIDNLKKPSYVQRVEIKQFSLGDEPLSVRNVERRTSRRVNDLQYQIGLRYTGGARMLLLLSLKFGIIPIVVPVGIRDFDIDGELWVKLRLIPTEPWIGAVSWAFVSLPKIKFELSPFRLFNLMDLPRLFVRPKKIVLDFQKGKALGPVPVNVKTEEIQEGNKDSVGELSVTLVDARKLAYAIFGKTDPYVVLSLGDHVIRSKKNSQTTVIGPPGEPIWNQDFHLLVANPRKQKLYIQVKDSFGFTDITIGTGEIELSSLQDTVPTDKIVALRGGWNLLRNQLSGELLLRLTYKAYVEDEEDAIEKELVDTDASDDESSEYEQADELYEQRFSGYPSGGETESFMDVLAALLVSEEFRGIVSSETGTSKVSEQSAYPESPASRKRGRAAEISALDADSASGGFKGSYMVVNKGGEHSHLSSSSSSRAQVMGGTSNTNRLHFVLIPWLAPGHMLPMIDIACLLAEHGTTVTVVTTPANASRIGPTIDRVADSGLPVRFVSLRFPAVEAGLPEGCESVDAIPSSDLMINFFNTGKLLKHPLIDHLRGCRPAPSCVITGSHHAWADDVALEFGVPCLVFRGYSCFSLLSIENLHLYKTHERAPLATEPFVLPGLPHRVEIKRCQLPRHIERAHRFAEMFREIRDAESSSDGIVVNSFDELEVGYGERLAKATGKKVWNIGRFRWSATRGGKTWPEGKTRPRSTRRNACVGSTLGRRNQLST